MRFARAKRGQVIIYDTEKLSYSDRIEFPVRYMRNAGLETSLWWKRRARESRIAWRTMLRLSSAAARRSALRISRRASAARRSRLARNDDLLSLLACGLASVLADWLALQDSGLLSAGVHAAVLAGRLARIAVVIVLASARLLALILAGLRASRGTAGLLALVVAVLIAVVSLLSDDDNWLRLLLSAAGLARRHALRLALSLGLAGLLAGALARALTDGGAARALALIVAVGLAGVILLDDNDWLAVSTALRRALVVAVA